MAHFLVEYRDIGSAEARDKHRGEHIAYRKGLGDAMRLAGPILNDAGVPIGSLVILEAEDRAAAERLSARDPYVISGVLQLETVRGYRIAVMKPAAS
jgi:uncharacterized protein YciI